MIDLDGMHAGGDIEEDAPVNELNEPQPAPIKDAFDDLLAHYSTKPAAPSAATSSSFSLTQQQQDRIAENKRRAEEKRKSRLNETINSQALNTSETTTVPAPDATDSTGSQTLDADKTADPSADNEELMDIDAMLDDITHD